MFKGVGLVFNFVYGRAGSSSLVVLGGSGGFGQSLCVFANTNFALDLNSKNAQPCKG